MTTMVAVARATCAAGPRVTYHDNEGAVERAGSHALIFGITESDMKQKVLTSAHVFMEERGDRWPAQPIKKVAIVLHNGDIVDFHPDNLKIQDNEPSMAIRIAIAVFQNVGFHGS